MSSEALKCPKCGHVFDIGSVVSDRVASEVHAAVQSGKKEKEIELLAQFKERERELTNRLVAQRADLEKQSRLAAEEACGLELADLRTQLSSKSELLAKTRESELNLRKMQRELVERTQTLELELTRRIDEERTKIWHSATEKVTEEHRLKDAEKEKQLTDMKRQIEDLKRRAEQGSQQAQGEVLELDLEKVLGDTFRLDSVDPVAKGRRGGDVVQTIRTASISDAGRILWEAKNTKAWSDGWIDKVKEDLRASKAHLAVIVTEVLPKGVRNFCCVEGVWVTTFACVVGLATALREQLIQVAQAHNAQAGKSTKMEAVYSYLAGPEFRQRVEAIVESFTAMQVDLESEKRSMERVWAKREKHIRQVIVSTAGMYGELQGMIGASLPPVAILALPGEESSHD